MVSNLNSSSQLEFEFLNQKYVLSFSVNDDRINLNLENMSSGEDWAASVSQGYLGRLIEKAGAHFSWIQFLNALSPSRIEFLSTQQLLDLKAGKPLSSSFNDSKKYLIASVTDPVTFQNIKIPLPLNLQETVASLLKQRDLLASKMESAPISESSQSENIFLKQKLKRLQEAHQIANNITHLCSELQAINQEASQHKEKSTLIHMFMNQLKEIEDDLIKEKRKNYKIRESHQEEIRNAQAKLIEVTKEAKKSRVKANYLEKELEKAITNLGTMKRTSVVSRPGSRNETPRVKKFESPGRNGGLRESSRSVRNSVGQSPIRKFPKLPPDIKGQPRPPKVRGPLTKAVLSQLDQSAQSDISYYSDIHDINNKENIANLMLRPSQSEILIESYRSQNFDINKDLEEVNCGIDERYSSLLEVIHKNKDFL